MRVVIRVQSDVESAVRGLASASDRSVNTWISRVVEWCARAGVRDVYELDVMRALYLKELGAQAPTAAPVVVRGPGRPSMGKVEEREREAERRRGERERARERGDLDKLGRQRDRAIIGAESRKRDFDDGRGRRYSDQDAALIRTIDEAIGRAVARLAALEAAQGGAEPWDGKGDATHEAQK